MAEFRKNTEHWIKDVGRWEKVGVVRRPLLKIIITFQRAMTKKVVSFFKNRVTPPVAAPGDTNPSDATAAYQKSVGELVKCGAGQIAVVKVFADVYCRSICREPLGAHRAVWV